MNRRQMLKLTSAGAITALGPGAAKARLAETVQAPVHRWEVFELILPGPSAGNPFVEVQWTATFALGHRNVAVDGFYDGAGKYKLRFMPDTEGEWSYATTSSVSDLSGKTGGFTCIAALPSVHGPVTVRNTHHFAYADGTPFFPFGTTCYA